MNMKSNPKILDSEAFQSYCSELKKSSKKTVLCYGHFNVIHPGHLRFLNFAKKQGDILVIAIIDQNNIGSQNVEDYFTEEERALGVASLEMVDVVHIVKNSIIDVISTLKPTFYVKGREFENKKNLIQDEIAVLEKNHGQMIFNSGESESSTFKKTSYQNPLQVISKRKNDFLKICQKNEISLQKIKDNIDSFSNINIMVIGDTIVDQFISCEMLGVSSEAPVLTIREQESKEFIGGAAIVAEHIKSLGAKCTFISVLGDDPTSDFVKKQMKELDIDCQFHIDPSRPTTYKVRYMVDNQKLLRVSRLKQHNISNEIEERILAQLENAKNYQGIVISDFVYGLITQKILNKIFEISKIYNVKVFGDTQCSSQLGNVAKYKSIELITPTEKEARIALADQSSGLEALAQKLIKETNNNSIVLTLGHQGLLAYSHKANHDGAILSEYFPALEENALDVAGAGDSVLSGYALGLCSGMDLMESSAFASCLAAISVSRIGNIPIKIEEIKSYLQEIITASSEA